MLKGYGGGSQHPKAWIIGVVDMRSNTLTRVGTFSESEPTLCLQPHQAQVTFGIGYGEDYSDARHALLREARRYCPPLFGRLGGEDAFD